MSSQPQNDRIRALEEQVETLQAEQQRSRRRWRGLAVALVGLGVIAAGAGPSIVRAERFELVDRDGVVRGVLGTDGTSPYLQLDDDQGGSALVQAHRGSAAVELNSRTGESSRLSPATHPDEPTTPSVLTPELQASLDRQGLATGPALIDLQESEGYVSASLTCFFDRDFRYLVPFEKGVARFPVVPIGAECYAWLRGGGPPRQIPIEGYDALHCEVQHSRVSCDRDSLQ